MRNVLFCFLILLLVACKENPTTTNTNSDEPSAKTDTVNSSNELNDAAAMASLNWLIGDWQNTSGEIKMYESWWQEKDHSFSAKSISVVGNDTVFSETMKLHTANDSIYMTVTGAQEDTEQMVTFTLISAKDKTFTFENKKHDFPQQIVYSNPSRDTIHAWIIGIQDGQERKSDFYFERVVD